MDIKKLRDEHRAFLKTDIHNILSCIESDQNKGLPQPPLEKPYPKDVQLIELVKPEDFKIGKIDLLSAINNRRSIRKFSEKPLTLEELSFLLWATQGVKKVIKDGYATLRTVPSAGARHPFETYLFVNAVEGLERGIYRYIALEHKLMYMYSKDSLKEDIIEGCNGQKFAGNCAVTFIWAVVPYRTEWRYILSGKKVALDAGHICQNLYLACEAINAGTCAIGAYNQKKMDEIIKVDGKEEFTVYISPVGKK